MIEKNNSEIISEAFNIFKKKGYSEQLKDSQAQYTPVKNSDDVNNLIIGDAKNGFVVSDPDAVKEKLVKGLGMALGANTVKSLANKAIKSFPIIVSDDISPETLVIVKTMMEEQYASYIDLLVSNQIINITDYQTDSPEGNIAIQALNRLDGTDFGKGRIARKAAQTGKLDLDDLMQNYPGWQFIKEDSDKLVSGNPILDSLLENAIIVPSEYSGKVAEKVYETILENITGSPSTQPYSAFITSGETDINDATILSKIRTLKNDNTWVPNSTGKEEFLDGEIFVDMASGLSYKRVNGYWTLLKNDENIDKLDSEKSARILNTYKKYGLTGNIGNTSRKYTDTLYAPSSLTLDNNKVNDLLDLSVAEILSGDRFTDKKQKEISNFIKDRYEKASFLLVNKRISGFEYVSYVRDRLGLPLTSSIATSLMSKYPTTTVEFKGINASDKRANEIMASKIENQYSTFQKKIVPAMLKITARDIVILSGGAVAGAGLAAGGAALAGALAVPVLLPIVAAGAATGLATVAIIKAINKHKLKRFSKLTNDGSVGWERVEFLINQMELSTSTALNNYKELKNDALMTDADREARIRKENNEKFAEFSKSMDEIIKRCAKENRLLTESTILNPKSYDYYKQTAEIESVKEEFLDCLEEAILEFNEDEIRQIVTLDEGKILLHYKKPGDIIVKQQKVNTKELASVVPAFGTKDVVAYGSVEFDRRDIKDRKFNEPLILTIKFRERYSDGKYNDNELTAVIGILGVVTRVPSDEMAYILKTNAEGVTLKNLFGFEDGKNVKDNITNILATFSKSKYSEKLPVSGKVWSNLEKVTALAVSNSLSGNNNGNISNAHLVFSQREVDAVKNELGIDYLKNAKLAARLMRRYSAFMLAVCNDVMQYLYTYSDPDSISWDDAPYSAYMGKSNSDQLLSAFTQYNRQRL